MATADTPSQPTHGRCPRCGDTNPRRGLVCSGCGARLPWADDVDAYSPAGQPRSTLPAPAAPIPVQGPPTSSPTSAPAPAAPRAPAPAVIATPNDLQNLPANSWVAPNGNDIVDSTTNVVYKAQVFTSAASLVPLAVGCVICTLIGLGLVITGIVPWWLVVGFLAFLDLMLVLSVLTVYRMASVQMDPAQRPRMDPLQRLSLDEQRVTGAVAGLLSDAWRTEVLGVGQVRQPQNAMIATDQSICFIVVPMAGVGQIVAGTDFSLWQAMLAKPKIQEKLEHMLAAASVEEIVNSDAANLVLRRSDIKTLTVPRLRVWGPIGTSRLRITTHGGQRYNYFVWDPKDYQKVQQMLGVP